MLTKINILGLMQNSVTFVNVVIMQLRLTISWWMGE